MSEKASFGRREFVRLASGAAFGGLAIPATLAQDRRVFGVKLPKEIAEIIPEKPLAIAQTAEAIIRLEKIADEKKLPQSPLALHKGESLPLIADSLYAAALPRLVALIDRSEAIDEGLANQAGEWLARLHASEYAVPDLWRAQGLLAAQPQQATRPFLSIDEMQTATPPLSLPDGAVAVPDPVPDAAPPVPEVVVPPAEPEGEIGPVRTEEKPEDTNKPLSRRRDFNSLRGEYVRLYKSIELREANRETAEWHVSMIQRYRDRYEKVGRATSVPWYFIAATHALESSFNFKAHLHNGDYPLSARTRQVPAGRPRNWLPPSDWESSARDALNLMGFTGHNDWSLERTLYRLEAYNGLGYRSYGVPTPYLWSFSNHYERGKYVSDGRWNPRAKSQQCGAAVMMKLLEQAGAIKLEY